VRERERERERERNREIEREKERERMSERGRGKCVFVCDHDQSEFTVIFTLFVSSLPLG